MHTTSIPKDAIIDFHGEYFWLDNFSPYSVRWDNDVLFPTVEHGFVYFKTQNPILRDTILACPDPGDAKYLGRTLTLRSDWDNIKFGIMYELVFKKFSQHPELQKLLLATGDRFLLEGNTWDDNIWGDCFCEDCQDIPGQNFLGKTLMSIRAQYQELA